MDIGWWISTGLVFLVCSINCVYYELRCKDAYQAIEIWKQYANELRERSLKLEWFKLKLNRMHRRAQRAEAERDKLARYGTLRIAEEIVSTYDLYKLRKWYKKSGYYNQERLYENSKDVIVKDIAKFMLESYDRRS